MALGGVPATGGDSAAGGAVGTGGSTSASGGVVGVGGTQATGGQIGAGGAVSGAGSSSLDACSSDADCTTCIWVTTPTSSSQCSDGYCCGGMISSKGRCESNQAAWAAYCPNRSPTIGDCPCVVQCPGRVACVGGQCLFSCSPVGGAGGSVVLPPSSGGYSGNEGAGGMGGAFLGMGCSSSTGGSNGGSSGTGGASGGVVTCTFGGLLVDAQPLASYTESGITVLATAGSWQARTGYGNPAPFIEFIASATGEVRVTAGGSAFRFVSVDLYSSVTTIPYVFTGQMGSTKMFSVSGTVPGTFGNFATVASANAGDLIDTLVIELTDGVAQNPMGLDNVRLSR